MGSVLQWFAVIIEFTGLSLVALELYVPRLTSRVADILEGTTPISKSDQRSATALAAGFVAVWVLGGVAVVTWWPDLNLMFHIGMTAFSVLVWLVAFSVSKLVRIGVFLGRGNSVGGVGLVLALIGFALEVSQLV